MREIKFRGKRIDNGDWAYGNLLYDEEHNEAYIAEYFEDRSAYIREVNTDTVGQHTGLKDKNGVEIYEGDIVRCWGGEQCQGYHEFDEEITVNDMTYDAYYVGQWDEYLIVGNIHEKGDK